MNKTVSQGVSPYLIGEKLRTLRLKKSMGLEQFPKHTGLSPAMLSKLERGRLFPTLPTLLRIAMVFSVGLDHFFTGKSKRHVIAISRKKERLRFPERPGGAPVSYFFESLDFPATERKLNAFYAEFQAADASRLKGHQHSGVEFIYLLTGKLKIKIGSEEHILNKEDSIYFDSGVQHTYSSSSLYCDCGDDSVKGLGCKKTTWRRLEAMHIRGSQHRRDSQEKAPASRSKNCQRFLLRFAQHSLIVREVFDGSGAGGDSSQQ
jgi:transcriptional regulator with XRE-family HTH domain